jgi:lysozyme
MLRRHEGVESHAYLCSQNFTTIGVGRNIDAGDNGRSLGLGLSDDEVDYLLRNDIDRVVEELDDEFSWFAGLNDARSDAMVDISFNLGQTRLRGFRKALEAMESGEWEEASRQFLESRWADQVGNRAVELAEIIRTGEYRD